MKKTVFILSAIALSQALSVHAAWEYPLLRFYKDDGSVEHLASESLKLTFTDGFVTVSNNETSVTFTSGELKAMRFVRSTAGAAEITGTPVAGSVEVFSTTGLSVGSFDSIEHALSSLTPGIYIVKQGDNIYKIATK